MSKKTKIKKVKLELYARVGLDLFDASKFPNIVKVFISSAPIITQKFKYEELPHRVYVSHEDMIELNKMVFGKERSMSFGLYISKHKDASELLRFSDIAEAPPSEELYKAVEETIEEIKPQMKIAK